jgi:hypothetical protein
MRRLDSPPRWFPLSRARLYIPLAFQVTAALTLSAAAILKTQQLASGSSPPAEEPVWFQIFLIVLELALAVWVVSGLRPSAANFSGLVWFSVLLGAALVKALSGDVSCGCFGKVSMSPWAAAAVDSAIVFGFLFSPPAMEKAEQ